LRFNTTSNDNTKACLKIAPKGLPVFN